MVLPGSHDRRVLWNNSDVLSNLSLHYRYFRLTRKHQSAMESYPGEMFGFVSKLRGKL